jgi:hypothetical protein
MEQPDIKPIVNRLWRVDTAADTITVSRFLELIPAPLDWMVAESPPRVYLLLGGDAIVTITVEADGEGGIRMGSRPLGADKLIVGLRWGHATTGEEEVHQPTFWTFRYLDEKHLGDEELRDWQRIEGRVSVSRRDGSEKPDRSEQFARSIFSRVGRPASVVGEREVARS